MAYVQFTMHEPEHFGKVCWNQSRATGINAAYLHICSSQLPRHPESEQIKP